jgi:hypothetical protein
VHFLASLIHSERDEDLDEVLPLDPTLPLLITTKTKLDDKGDQVEAQFIGQGVQHSLVAGAAYTKSDRVEDVDVTLTDPGGVIPLEQGTSEEKIKQPRAYAYANFTPAETVTLTLGASYDDYEEGTLEETSFNPKFGVQWDVTNRVRLRAAAFKVLKPALVNNRTLEPTQIAGFNQLFDDRNGAKSERYAGGLDWRLNRDLAAGAEITVRNLEDPAFLVVTDPFGTVISESWVFENREEQNHRLYLFWTPMQQLAVRAELVYDRFDSDSGVLTEAGLPEQVTTQSLPVGVTWFSPSGVFVGVGGTLVNQEVQRSATSPLAQASGSDDFFVADAALGYRLGKRRGTVSVAVKNLFDTEFNYQDDSYREFRDEPSTGPYFPVRTVMARIALGF